MAQQEYILQLQNVVKRFGGITASNDITINVPRGSIYGIIGPNGAGKTTLFNMITGVYDTTEGKVLFEGQQVNGLPTHVIAARGIARTFQNIRLFGDLSVYDNLLTACQKNITYGLLDGILRTEKCRSQERESREFCDRLLEEVGLSDQRQQRANNLPYGMQRRLEIARALATRPKLILLDEPAAGMNEEESDKLSEFIREIREKKDVTVVIIDHHMDVIMAICDQISVLNFGTLLAEGKPDEIQNNPEVISAYLGVDE
ncbi:ABC transporter ATP-binding protein [Clostridium sp. AF18-27]|uniref:Amino acid/amide ABC transporter ATP-binding protein 1, HAAT family n=1 Tax=Enterocloster lavalensis TaxID=460384 RepID=A0A1I0KCX7_9FIRM|nr:MULTISPECIES: ABC transporter ATP-binding protein [Enterocloster]MBS5607645.1 ABC transporter ATP-binding protein [Enterocloster asparagiformis]RHR54401.1 ABC transporter ATP-binding protein [Clostridium sp. AF18-27]MCB6342816.1 ABC transporter ATP-binding protein [Enterocloster lavalensis]MDR3758792.1 ABC transporter ATP-binding protein [Enterocloster sp.]SEU22158.1 amino acid/amide ABC transporter ATP-binding protein 1, HAAT family [Enterocloster lavalensis]